MVNIVFAVSPSAVSEVEHPLSLPIEVPIKVPSEFSLLTGQTAKVTNYQDMKIRLTGIFTNPVCNSDDVTIACQLSNFKEYVKVEISTPGGCGPNASPECLGPPGMAAIKTIREGESVKILGTKLTLLYVNKYKARFHIDFDEGVDFIEVIEIPTSFKMVKGQTTVVTNVPFHKEMRIHVNDVVSNPVCNSDDVTIQCPGSHFREYAEVVLSTSDGYRTNADPRYLGSPVGMFSAIIHEGESVDVQGLGIVLTLLHVDKNEAKFYIEFLSKEPKNYVLGEVLVGFHKHVTEKEANDFFNDYNPNLIKWESHFSKNGALKWGVVTVPEGDEHKWIKIFESREIVRYAELNGIVSVPGPIVPPTVIVEGSATTVEGSIDISVPQSGIVEGQESTTSIQKDSVVQEGSAVSIQEGLVVQETSEENKEAEVTPSIVSETATNQLRLKEYKIELKDVGKSIYEVIGSKSVKFIGLFNTEMMVKSLINAETGNIEKTEKPWWGFLVIE